MLGFRLEIAAIHAADTVVFPKTSKMVQTSATAQQPNESFQHLPPPAKEASPLYPSARWPRLLHHLKPTRN